MTDLSGTFQAPPRASIYAMVGVASLFLALSWIIVALRVYVRGFIIRRFGLDDSLMLLTLVFFTINCAVVITMSRVELVDDISQFPWLLKTISVSFSPQEDCSTTTDTRRQFLIPEFAFYICTTIIFKLSLAVFFLRVAMTNAQRWVVYGTVSTYTMFTIAYLFAVIFQCGNPRPRTWLIHQVEGRCIPWSVIGPLSYIHGSLNLVTDWTFAILPVFVVQKAELSSRIKISVWCILAIGAIGSIASVVRLAYIDALQFESTSWPKGVISIAIASIVEPGIAIIAGSLATLHPLLNHVMDRGIRRSYLSSNPLVQELGLQRGVRSLQETEVPESPGVCSLTKPVPLQEGYTVPAWYHNGSQGRGMGSTTIITAHAHSNQVQVELRVLSPSRPRAPSMVDSVTRQGIKG